MSGRPGERNCFVLIHGFNVSFAEAAIRAAQLGYDLKVPGEMAFFSWPSRGGVLDYSADEATITASVEPARGLPGTSSSPVPGPSGCICSSTAWATAVCLTHWSGSPPASARRCGSGQVFFCAPDEDVRTFADKTRLFPQECENRTLLVSPGRSGGGRLALEAPARPGRHWSRRCAVYAGIETVAVTGFGLLDLGHGYFAEAEPVIEDLREAIESRRPAGERQDATARSRTIS